MYNYVQVCRQSNYHQHALYLAEKCQQYDWYVQMASCQQLHLQYTHRYVKIQLEDINQYRDALEYIKRCPPQSVSNLVFSSKF